MVRGVLSVVDLGFGQWLPDVAAPPKARVWIASPTAVRRARCLVVWLACVIFGHIPSPVIEQASSQDIDNVTSGRLSRFRQK